ncbi:Abhydrolase domain-containing protein 4 [Folsomia candida]|uniref:Abhydrolase domain-containing protein 4 n=1 Tax=Folsomia candida TaxID=158441 RepID=A0A226F5S7_FOLCA|nr:Abhydrolase domain-containing protein 4 [Folsomia candida]
MAEEILEDSADVSLVYEPGWMRRVWNRVWFRTSSARLQNAETSLLQHVGASYNAKYVKIGPILSDNDIYVWTFSSNENLEGHPLVFLHGLGSGLGLWTLNFKGMIESQTRPVYAIDMPGFGRSSRPDYSCIPEEAENQLVQVIEAWRAKMNLEKIILLGHSFGGICLSRMDVDILRVHIILADPWGFKRPPTRLLDAKHSPFKNRYIANALHALPINPLWSLRVAGPLGPRVLKMIRADIIKNFSTQIDDAETKISNYVYHSNVQNSTGESAFYTLMNMFGWAKNPMEMRLETLDDKIPLTLIYGSKSWVDHYPAEEIVNRRPGSYVNFHVLDAGHHVYADKFESFNQIVIDACQVGVGDAGQRQQES